MSDEREQLRRSEANVHMWTWKTPAMKCMTLAVCRLALAKGTAEFSAKDLASFEHGGSGICGNVFAQMATDGVIAPVTVTFDNKVMQKITFNKGGNRIGVWRLANRALAERLLEVHGQPVPKMVQQDFPAVPTNPNP
jgi:hypothetical protein